MEKRVLPSIDGKSEDSGMGRRQRVLVLLDNDEFITNVGETN